MYLQLWQRRYRCDFRRVNFVDNCNLDSSLFTRNACQGIYYAGLKLVVVPNYKILAIYHVITVEVSLAPIAAYREFVGIPNNEVFGINNTIQVRVSTKERVAIGFTKVLGLERSDHEPNARIGIIDKAVLIQVKLDVVVARCNFLWSICLDPQCCSCRCCRSRSRGQPQTRPCRFVD